MSGTPSFEDNEGRGGLRRRDALGGAMAGGLALSGLSSPARAASGVRTLTSPAQLRATYDHVIVGAGSAGCVLAHRLGRAGRRVLLIEAGGRADLPAVAIPPDWPRLQESALDWRYVTTPQPGLGGRAITCPRGKAVGGSTQDWDWRPSEPSKQTRWQVDRAAGTPGVPVEVGLSSLQSWSREKHQRTSARTGARWTARHIGRSTNCRAAIGIRVALGGRRPPRTARPRRRRAAHRRG